MNQPSILRNACAPGRHVRPAPGRRAGHPTVADFAPADPVDITVGDHAAAARLSGSELSGHHDATRPRPEPTPAE